MTSSLQTLQIDKQPLYETEKTPKKNKSKDDDAKTLLPFVFNKLDNIVFLDYSKDAPAWRIVNQGLNLRGACSNKNCKAFKQVVWIQKGIGEFHMSREVCVSKCPECKQTAKKIQNLGFHNCKYDIEGMKEGSDVTFQKNGQTEEGKLLTFKHGDNVKWQYLVVKATSK